MNDPVNNPRHYTSGKIECLDAIEAMSGFEDFCGYLRASIVKYLWRAKSKGKVLEDVRKAQFYMNKLVAALEVATAEVATAEADKAGSALIADPLNQTNEVMAGMPFKPMRKAIRKPKPAPKKAPAKKKPAPKAKPAQKKRK